jgi:glucose-1-phosphate thymidylyltransferase
MKALVPAGGRGVRLRPITYTNAKQLIPVAGEPVLFRVLHQIAEAGIVACGIVVGDTAEEMRAAIGDGSRFGLSVTWIEQATPAGLADCVRVARGFLGEDPFLMYLGDNMLADGVASLVEAFERDPVAAQILTVRVPDPQRFGVVSLKADGSVERVVEKPAEPSSDLALAGVYVFDPAVHDVIATLQPSVRGELEITDAIQGLIDRGLEVRAHEVSGWWKDTGLASDLLDANRLVMAGFAASRVHGVVNGCAVSGMVIVEAGAVIEQGALIGPCVVGAGARLHDAVVGPNAAIGAGSVLRGARVEDSIVMDECTITDASLRRSVLGRGVQVSGRGSAQLVVGDHGSVSLG